MTPSRLLPLCFLATLCLAQAAAQSAPALQPKATTPPDVFLPTPPLTTFPPLTGSSPQLTPSTTFYITPNAAAAILALDKRTRQLTTHSGSCYTMRSYVITPEDMKSNSPKPSSSTTCTESATVQMKHTTLPSRP